MASVELDPEEYPNLTGVERPFFEYWREHVLSDADPHRDRWIQYEERAVVRAEGRRDLLGGYSDLDGKDVLDVGCQNGAWLVALARAGARPTGIDVVPTAIECARLRTSAYGVDARVELASACEMPFDAAAFDVVASSDVLEHVPDKVAMLQECVRVLRPGGLLFLRAPCRFSVKHFLKDPHYGRPGISVLPGRAAGWVATRAMGEPAYEVETLPTRSWTVRRLRDLGMEIVEPAAASGGRSSPLPGAVARLTDELRQGFTVAARKVGAPLAAGGSADRATPSPGPTDRRR